MPPVAANELEPTFILPEGLTGYLEQRGSRGDTDSHGQPMLESTPFRRTTSGVRLVREQEAADQEDHNSQLLRSRLRAAAWVIWAGLALLFVWQVSLGGEVIYPSLTGALLVIAVGGLILLYGPRSLSSRQLRGIELLLFGVAGVQMIILQIVWMTRHGHSHNAMELVATLDKSVLGFAMLMLSYGMFMPNGIRRTAVMVSCGALAPLVTAAFLRWSEPQVASVISPLRLLEAGGILLTCAAIAVFSTYTMAALRHEAHRAQKFGQYRLKRLLGWGGMGEVYLAEHQLLKRPCAVKVIRPHHVHDPVALVRFEREVRAMAKLSHWHSVEVFDYGRTEDGTFYYVMEYLPGLNLVEIVQRSGPLPPGRVIHFLEQTCAALGEAHQQGLVHRDLKPANIFAAYRGGEYDVTKLLDFGLVLDVEPQQFAESEMTDAALVGSPTYMAPEQVRSDQYVGPASDLYSLGAVGYFLLTGHPPFERASLLRMIMAHAKEPVLPPSTYRSDIPGDLEQIILRCLAKEPCQRYASAQELRQALKQCRDAGAWSQTDAESWWITYAPEQLNCTVEMARDVGRTPKL